jgi:hypothetical protein
MGPQRPFRVTVLARLSPIVQFDDHRRELHEISVVVAEHHDHAHQQQPADDQEKRDECELDRVESGEGNGARPVPIRLLIMDDNNSVEDCPRP